MAKKTLQSILACPIDFLYLWASDGFIAQLGSRAKVIKQKKYYQYQALWKTMVENTSASSADALQKEYNVWVEKIAAEIKNTYNMTPAEILQKLAMGEEVLGKDWNSGVYGVGATNRSNFSQASNVTVDSTTGKIVRDGQELANQTAIYGTAADGTAYVKGYSVVSGDVQFQSCIGSDGQYYAYSYSKGDGTVQTADGKVLDSSKNGFWQNANNYMPIINQLLEWVSSIVNSLFPNRTVLTNNVTVPTQDEWVETDNNTGMWVLGGLAVAGAALIAFGDKIKK